MYIQYYILRQHNKLHSELVVFNNTCISTIVHDVYMAHEVLSSGTVKLHLSTPGSMTNMYSAHRNHLITISMKFNTTRPCTLHTVQGHSINIRCICLRNLSCPHNCEILYCHHILQFVSKQNGHSG